jgi:hypothetical protein
MLCYIDEVEYAHRLKLKNSKIRFKILWNRLTSANLSLYLGALEDKCELKIIKSLGIH